MGYVAAKGGTQAILNAEQLVEYFRLEGGSEPVSVSQIRDQLRLAVDRTMSEGALYAPDLAALAIKQSEGDAIEASFLLRAYRSTLPRFGYTLPSHGSTIRVIRRISANFRDIPGGQLLGPTRDYSLRLLNTALLHESTASVRRFLDELANGATANEQSERAEEGAQGVFPKVVDRMREQGILAAMEADTNASTADAEPFDITREALGFPAPRSARLQALVRGDVGSVLTFAYSSVRGYGDAHPTLAELRVGYLPVEVAHPVTGEPLTIGELLVTECEIASKIHTSEDGVPKFSLGYGFCFGHGEVKAIGMAILDRVLSSARSQTLGGESGPATDEEFVLQHIDGVESSGFTAHYKLPHYVAFEADVRVLERDQLHATARAEADAERRESVARRRPELFGTAEGMEE